MERLARRTSRSDSYGLAIALFAVLFTLLLYALWNVPYVATHDGPNHLANCVLANRLEDPASPLHNYLEYGAPVTTQGFQVVCETFESLFGWRAAYALSLTVVALLWAFGYAALALSIDRRSPFVLAGFISALGWAFSMGFVTWSMTVGIAFFALAYLISRTEMTLRVWAVMSFFLVLAAYSHTFVAAMLGVAVVLIAVVRAEPTRRLLAFGAAAAAGLPAMALAFLSSTATEVGATAWQSWSEKLARVFDNFVGGPLYRSVPASLFALFALLLAGFGVFKRAGTKTQAALGVFAFVCLLAYLVIPYHYSKWAYLGPRPLIFGLALAPLAIPVQYLDIGRTRVVALVLTFSIAAISLGWFARHNLELEPAISESLSGLKAPIQRTGARLTLMMANNPETEVAEANPMLMIAHLYLFDEGGIDPYVWAGDPTKDAIVFKQSPAELFGPHPPRFLVADVECAGKSPDCPPLAEQYEYHAREGEGFEDVILLSDDPAAHEVFLRRGYTPDFRQGKLSILRPPRP